MGHLTVGWCEKCLEMKTMKVVDGVLQCCKCEHKNNMPFVWKGKV